MSNIHKGNVKLKENHDILHSWRISVFFIMVNLAVEIKFDLALILHLRFFFLLVVEEMRVKPIILLELSLAYLIVICLIRVPFYIPPKIVKLLDGLLLALHGQQIPEQLPEPLPHSEHQRPGKQSELLSVPDHLQVLIQDLVIFEQALDIAQGVEPAVVGVCLPRH